VSRCRSAAAIPDSFLLETGRSAGSPFRHGLLAALAAARQAAGSFFSGASEMFPGFRTTGSAVGYGLGLWICALPVSADSLTLTIENIRSDVGSVMVNVGPAAAFAGTEPFPLQIILPAREGRISLTTDALEPGEYAAQLFHDLNGNGELDTNLVGMPREPWGMSNGARGNFGPPRFEDAQFVLEGDTVVPIRLER